MTSGATSVLGANWQKNAIICRRNPKNFIDSLKLTHQTFCLDVLKDLYSDSVDVQCKFHLLLILQENSSLLFQDIDLIEQTVGSLQNLYCTLENIEEKALLKCQIVITITTILLTWKNVEEAGFKFVLDVKGMLLKIILSEMKNQTLKSTACQCLEEIEIFYPNILKNDLEDIFTSCQRYLVTPVQDYLILLSTCLRHFTEFQAGITEGAYSEKIRQVINRQNSSYATESEINIMSFMEFVLDHLPQMSQASVFITLENLICVVNHSPDLLPVIFKPLISRLTVSSDILYFHLAFDLLRIFGLELFSTQEQQLLLQQLISCASHPCLTTSQKLLYLNWLEICFTDKNLFSISSSSVTHNSLYPLPFDGPYTQEKKIKLLYLYMQQNSEKEPTPELLLNCLEGLKKCTMLGTGVKASAAFFRTVYVMFSLFKSTAVTSQVHKLLLDVQTRAPFLAPFVLSFLNCVKDQCDGRPFSDSILAKLVDHVLSLPVKQLTKSVQDFLLILEEAAVEAPNISKPQATLRCLYKLLNEQDVFNFDRWILGHSILNICHLYLKVHDAEVLYYDLGELLNMIMKVFDDIDVKIRAKQYYAALTSLSKTRVKSLFQTQSFENSSAGSLTTFVTGTDLISQSRNIMHKLPEPVLRLTRMDQKAEYVGAKFTYADSDHFEDVLELYLDFVHSKSFHPAVKFSFYLKQAEDIDEKFSVLYALIIHVLSDPLCKNLSDIDLPVLRKQSESSYVKVVNVTLIPAISAPVTLHFRSQFTCSDGYSYSTLLPSISIGIEDLFLPLPICKTEHLNKIFEVLWKKFEKELDAEQEDPHCCKSTFYLQCPNNQCPEVLKNWEVFTVASLPEVAEVHVAIYLPPLSHLLMKIMTQENALFFVILTDNWSVLPWINIYFKKICKIYS